MAGLVNLIKPGAIPQSFLTPLLLGLESYGPYMLFLGALVAGAVAWGLWKFNNIVRDIAQLIAIAGIVILVPYVSAATVKVKFQPLVLGGLGIIVRVIVAWNLSREEAAEAFHRRPSTRRGKITPRLEAGSSTHPDAPQTQSLPRDPDARREPAAPAIPPGQSIPCPLSS
jgi:hypothetical protein